MKLAEAMNTYNPALLVIKDLGYRLEFQASADSRGLGTWTATAGEHSFFASDPLVLLGLIALWQHRGGAWQKQSHEEDLYDKLLSEATEK